MNQKDEKWAVFWCDLLQPMLYNEIEPSQTNRFLIELSQKEVLFPDGGIGKPSLSTLRRKLKKYRKGGFKALARKPRSDRGKARSATAQVLATAIEIKKDQPLRSDVAINRFLSDLYGVSLPRSTLYRHLKEANATRLKLGVVSKKVRKRWSRDHTHDLWVGDFEEGPYVLVNEQVLPTHLSAFIDCHSRYVVEGRYYLRQNLDILIDSLIRALATHGAPCEIYLDNAKVYHANALKAACYRIHIRLVYRPPRDASPGGLIERFFETAQSQFEAEVRARDALTLEELNRAFCAWLNVSYHSCIHSETGQTPQQRYEKGLKLIRHVDMGEVLASFMQRVPRRVHPDFSDIQLHNRYYKVDPKLRGDKVEVHYDPFGTWDKVQIYSLQGQYLGQGILHHRETGQLHSRPQHGKPKYDYLKLLIRQHQETIAAKTRSIDYRKILNTRPWPFHAFVKTFAELLGTTGGLGAFSADELETLKKLYNRHSDLTENMLKEAFARAHNKSIPYVAYELQQLANRKEKE